MQKPLIVFPAILIAAGAVAASASSSSPPVGPSGPVQMLKRSVAAHADASHTSRVVSTAHGAACPKGLLPLTRNSIGPAVAAALAQDEATNRPQVTAAAIAARDTGRGAQVRSECGMNVQSRTVDVYITDRALLPSESASQRVLFVGRTRAGYSVWKRAH
jgi:hypothetical protein